MSEYVLLRDHIAIQKGRPPLITSYFGADAVAYLNPEYLRGNSGAEPAKPSADAVRAEDGETLLLWDGSNAGEFFRAKQGLVASTMARIVPDSTFQSAFFFHAVKHAEAYLKSRTSGTGIPHVDRELLEAIRVFRPKQNEQIIIAQILDTLDTAIRETEALIDKLKAVKQGLLHDLLTRGIDANGQLRPPQSEAPQLYKESPLGWIPREWELSTVGSEFEIQLGKMLDAQKNTGVMRPYLGNKSVQWDFIDLSEIQKMALSISDMERFRLKAGDLLVCEGGDVGRAAIWEGQLEECYYQKALHRLRPKAGFSTRLMLELLRYWMGREVLFEYISKTSIAHFTQEKFATVPLPLPSPDEQIRLVSAVLAHKQRQKQEERMLRKLMEQKQGLMDDLLTGRVRVTALLESVQQVAAQTEA